MHGSELHAAMLDREIGNELPLGTSRAFLSDQVSMAVQPMNLAWRVLRSSRVT